MSNLSNILSKLIGFKPQEVSKIFINLGILISIIFLAFSLILIGLAFLIWALYLFLKSFVSLSMAALLSGVITIIFSITIILLAKIIFTPTRSKKIIKEIDSDVEYESEINLLVAKHPMITVLTALISGFLMGNFPSERKEFLKAIIMVLSKKIINKNSDE